MADYDPKRPRRVASEEEPAPVDALIDLAAHDESTAARSAAPAEASTEKAAVIPESAASSVAGAAPDVVVTPDTPVVEGPTGDDDTARVVLALIGLSATVALVLTFLIRRRRRN
jgi:hypothetical protein